jgi:hypothetical protein
MIKPENIATGVGLLRGTSVEGPSASPPVLPPNPPPVCVCVCVCVVCVEGEKEKRGLRKKKRTAGKRQQI